jgi:UDP-N-acetyl-alpha-D-muramoyl-L-alanyl-L-glutamate epimerase
MTGMKDVATRRAELFRYGGLDVQDRHLVGHYELDGRHFSESVAFEGVGSLATPAGRAVAHLWYLLAGLSYYKAGAARVIDLADAPVGPRGRRLLEAAVHDGLAEFAYRNALDLGDVELDGGRSARAAAVALDERRVLIPFGGGIDSVVTATGLSPGLERALFIVSPSDGRFAALEATAEVTGLQVVRATRSLDPQLLAGDGRLLNGHVPVTAMVTLLAALAAVASGRGGVAMSNEHSSSVPNLRWRGSEVNHQWSKSLAAEALIADALAEAVGPGLVVASFLRDRSELWVARAFSELTAYHHVFRSCNRAFAQRAGHRAPTWCGECDKCLFINLVLAPFLAREALRAIFSGEPLANPALEGQLRALVGVGQDHKPFECVGDPGESAAALAAVAASPQWRDVDHVRELARLASPAPSVEALMAPQGTSRVPAHWLR